MARVDQWTRHITNKRDILFALLDALPANRMVTVRTPDAKAGIFGTTTPLSDTTGFTGTRQARTGHLNDCFLASDSDYGTYPSPVETWKSYIAQDANYVPEGGETCGLYSPRTDCPSATAEMARLHWTQLNSQYHTGVLDSWRTQGCFNDVRRKLGYRLTLRDATWTSAVKPGGVLELTVHLANEGYAALYNPRPMFAVLSAGTTVLRAQLAIEPRRWKSASDSTFTVRLRVPANLSAGTYKVSLWLPDEAQALRSNPAYTVRFANTNVWDAATGFNQLTDAFAVDPAAPGDVDGSATTFVQL